MGYDSLTPPTLEEEKASIALLKRYQLPWLGQISYKSACDRAADRELAWYSGFHVPDQEGTARRKRKK
jgi:hypothetical protein